MKLMKKLVLLCLFWGLFLQADICINEFFVDVEHDCFSSGLDFVDCVYVINLEKRSEKWNTTKNALLHYSIYPNRLNAVNGWELNQPQITRLMGPYPHRLRGGQIGCLLSHLSAVQDAYNLGYQCIWVCEDDIAIHENPHQLKWILNDLCSYDSDWDILYTDIDTKGPDGIRIPSLTSDFRPDQTYPPLSDYQEKIVINEDISRIKQRFGAYSMLISRKGMEKILNYFTTHYLWTAYDIDIHYIPGIKEYSLNRDLVSVNYKLPSDTEINQAS